MGRGREICARGRVARRGPARRILLRVEFSEHGVTAGLVQARIEDELTAALGIGAGLDQGPARQHIGERDDVVLGVAAAHAERMQLEDLAREILVETAGAVDPGDRVRAHRADIVEIEQHGRMAIGGKQQIGEAAQHVRRMASRS